MLALSAEKSATLALYRKGKLHFLINAVVYYGTSKRSPETSVLLSSLPKPDSSRTDGKATCA
jgi:hypothetical protein